MRCDNRLLFIGILILAIATLFPTAANAWELGVATEIGRTTERILIVLVSALCLSFGFQLFKVSAQHSGELLAQRGSWSLKLSQVGPGVFFALFGSAILITSIVTQPSIETKSDQKQVSIRGMMGAATKSSSALPDTLAALNTIVSISPTTVQGPLDPNEARRLRAAADELASFRPILLDEILGRGRYDEWKKINVQINNGLSVQEEFTSDPNLRNRYEEADKLMSSNLK
jgi:hypothetical protein